MYFRLLLAIFTISLFDCYFCAETSIVCKCDGKKCGEVKILSNLVPLAVKFAGLTQGSCSSQGYTENWRDIEGENTHRDDRKSRLRQGGWRSEEEARQDAQGQNPLFANKYTRGSVLKQKLTNGNYMGRTDSTMMFTGRRTAICGGDPFAEQNRIHNLFLLITCSVEMQRMTKKMVTTNVE